MRKWVAIFIVSLTTAASVGTLYAMNKVQDDHQNSSQDGSIEGQVIDSQGQPVAGARVFFEKSDFLTGPLPSATTDKQGVFSIHELPPGLYRVFVEKEKDGYASTGLPFHDLGSIAIPQVAVLAQQTTSNILVKLGPKAATLAGEIVDATTGRPVENTQIALQRVDDLSKIYVTAADLKGKFKILVPPVPFTIEVSAPGYQDWKYRDNNLKADTIHLSPGVSKQLIISLSPTN